MEEEGPIPTYHWLANEKNDDTGKHQATRQAGRGIGSTGWDATTVEVPWMILLEPCYSRRRGWTWLGERRCHVTRATADNGGESELGSESE